jgi:DNA-binding transcriptional LysR family regulator
MLFMDQSRSTLADVALFVEVARTSSFRLAAARLEIPPSTLSRRIAALEARLGVALFARTTRSVVLTSAAKPYFERCLEVLAAAERAQAALDGGQQRQARMRIAMPVDLGVEILGPLIAAFADQHPGLSVEFDLSSRASVDLLRDPVDLAWRIGKPMDDRVVWRARSPRSPAACMPRQACCGACPRSLLRSSSPIYLAWTCEPPKARCPGR